MAVQSPPNVKPPWEQIGDLMFFNGLDSYNGGVCTISYKFTDNGADPWTARLSRFKAKDAHEVRRACAALPEALAWLTWSVPFTAVVGAIPSKATSLDPGHPIAHLGAAIAARFGIPWRPDVLTKRAHQSLHFLKTAYDRQQEVHGVYVASAANLGGCVLIVDDLCTNGDTFADIRRAILATNPGATVYCAALGKTDRQSFWQGRGVTLTNDHVSQDLAAWWDAVP